MRIVRAAVGMLVLVWTAAGGAEAGAPGFGDILSGMEARLADTVDYQCRLETWSSNGEEVQEVVVAYAYRRPDRIRMEVLQGPYAGSLLLYDRERDPHRVRALAGNPVLAFLQRMLYGEFFAVDHRWVVDRQGGGIHQSHWPHFIAEHRRYLAAGRSRYLGEALLDGRRTYRYRLLTASPVRPRAIQREDVWVDTATFFPVQYRQYDASGTLLRRARVSELRFNTGIDPVWFREFHPSAGGGIAGHGLPDAPQ